MFSTKYAQPYQQSVAREFFIKFVAVYPLCAGSCSSNGGSSSSHPNSSTCTHWIRHSHASHAIAGGMLIEIAQQNLGHASLATTTIYVTTEKRRRMKAVEAFWRK